MALIFSSDPVWSQTTKSGFRQQVFVMYHSTDNTNNVANILDDGFNISQNNEDRNLLLGDGVYVTRDIEKTLSYGDVCFKLLVYPGKTFRLEEMEDPLRTKWQSEYSSAWLPPNNRVTPSGREETCVKSSSQVRVLGIAYGHELLDRQTRGRVRDCFGTGDTLDPQENRVLDMMLEDMGIIYSTFVHQGTQEMLETSGRGCLRLADWSGADNQLWTRSWDYCLENKATGRVLTAEEQGDQVALTEVEAAGVSSQKWRLDNRGRLLHKASNRFLSVESRGQGTVCLKAYNKGGDRESWRFRCLDETRTTDSFVNYTPWQDMISWA